MILTCYFLLPFPTLLPSFQSYKDNFISSPGHKAYRTVFSPNLSRKAFIWQVCTAALSAAVRGKDWHMIDVTALQFSLPSFPVMREFFFFPRQFYYLPWCAGSVWDWLSAFCEQGNWDQSKRIAVTNPQCPFVGRLPWLSECSSGTLEALWPEQGLRCLLGDSFQLCSLQWQVWIQYQLLKLIKIHVMIQVWIPSLVLWKTGVISWFGSICSAMYFRIYTEYAPITFLPFLFCWFPSSSPETEQEQMQWLWPGVNDKPSLIPYISPLLT